MKRLVSLEQVVEEATAEGQNLSTLLVDPNELFTVDDDSELDGNLASDDDEIVDLSELYQDQD